MKVYVYCMQIYSEIKQVMNIVLNWNHFDKLSQTITILHKFIMSCHVIHLLYGASWGLYSVHYENTPIQIYRKFHLQKLKIFR